MRTRVSLAGVVCLAALTLPASAANISFNFTTASSTFGSNGNSIVFTDTNGSGITATASAFANTGSGGTLATAALGRYGGGLGVCNSLEGFGSANCGTTGTPPEHAVSNSNGTDMVLIVFSQAINLGSVSLNAYGGTDISYFSGNLSGTVAGKALTSSAMSGIGLTTSGSGAGATSYSLNGTSVTALLVGAKIGEANDGFKISALSGTTPGNNIPEPSTYAMLGMALVGVGLLRRRMVR